MLDLSADNRDGFEDTDGQLYTSNSFYFRVKNMFYYERILCINRDQGWSEKRGEHVGFEC